MRESDINASPIASMFLMHMGSNVGYAIAPLERLFFDIGLALAGNDQSLVHFGYTDFVRGKPSSLPREFDNLIEFDFRSTTRRENQRLADYAREHDIKLALVFDVQPVHSAFRALRQGGVSTILGYYGCEISALMPAWKLAIKRLLFALSRSKMDGLIFESQAMADLAVLGRGVPKHRIDVVPLGVDLEVFQTGESSYVYDVMGLPRERKVIAYAGHMESRKGVHSLVDAAIDLLKRRNRKDVCFVLFGDRPHESEQYEKMYAGSGIEKLIRFGGYRSDLAEIYRGCFCGVIPSTGWDSFPRTSLEMAACGLPIIAARTGGLPEAVLHDRTGMIYETGNIQELGDCIETLLDHPEIAAQYSRAGRERCEMELSLDAQYERFLRTVQTRLDHQPSQQTVIEHLK